MDKETFEYIIILIIGLTIWYYGLSIVFYLWEKIENKIIDYFNIDDSEYNRHKYGLFDNESMSWWKLGISGICFIIYTLFYLRICVEIAEYFRSSKDGIFIWGDRYIIY